MNGLNITMSYFQSLVFLASIVAFTATFASGELLNGVCSQEICTCQKACQVDGDSLPCVCPLWMSSMRIDGVFDKKDGLTAPGLALCGGLSDGMSPGMINITCGPSDSGPCVVSSWVGYYSNGTMYLNYTSADPPPDCVMDAPFLLSVAPSMAPTADTSDSWMLNSGIFPLAFTLLVWTLISFTHDNAV